jgi:hypothetical protein
MGVYNLKVARHYKEADKLMQTLATDKLRITAYVDDKLKVKLDALCAIRNRSISNLVETLLREAVRLAEESGELAKDSGELP